MANSEQEWTADEVGLMRQYVVDELRSRSSVTASWDEWTEFVGSMSSATVSVLFDALVDPDGHIHEVGEDLHFEG